MKDSDGALSKPCPDDICLRRNNRFMGDAGASLADWLGEASPDANGLSSPKLTTPQARGAQWFRYYAGYADTFVADVVARLPEPAGVILDPWNGSGTTTSVAALHGVEAHGFDLNPAAVVVAKARLLQADIASSLMPLTREVLGAIEGKAPVEDDDLLGRWLTDRGVLSVRRLAGTIRRVFIEAEGLSTKELATEMSPLAAVFYLGLFRTVRESFAKFEGTNPTWIRQKVAPKDRVDVDLRTLRPSFLRVMSELSETVKNRGIPKDGSARVRIGVADSTGLPLDADSIDGVISSPPYCTRIDYAIATLPELIALGVRTDELRSLRDRLIGTPTRDGEIEADNETWGPTAAGFLDEVEQHKSHASENYYLPFFKQYLDGMRRSLSEISRVVAPGKPIVLVVQDSYYKEIHADVPRIISEMATNLGWDTAGRRDFQVRTKAAMNVETRKYRQARWATEAVLAFAR
jgi:DNA modification methylase